MKPSRFSSFALALRLAATPLLLSLAAPAQAAGTPVKLSITTPARSAAPGVCSPGIIVARLDSTGTQTTSGTTNVYASMPGATIYGNSSCTSPVTYRTISPGYPWVQFWYKGTVSATFTATATGLTGTSQFETVTGTTSPSPSPSASASPSPKPTVSPTPSPSPSPTASASPKPITSPSPTPTPTPTASTVACVPGANTSLKGFDVFPPTNPWRQDISSAPVDALSSTYIANIGTTKPVRTEFGSGTWDGGPIGIPYVVVTHNTPKVPLVIGYPDESDPGPFPFPPNAPIEGGPNGTGDRHVLAVSCEDNMLYESYSSYPLSNGSWQVGSSAQFDLRSTSGNGGRPKYWTSADAAGLPIFPGLVRYDEVYERKEINHALRFTVDRTQSAFVSPASHSASYIYDPSVIPMGARLRLKASVDISKYSPANQVILRALKKYGMFVADNGGDMFITGAPNEGWNNDELRQLMGLTANDFEVIATGPITKNY